MNRSDYLRAHALYLETVAAKLRRQADVEDTGALLDAILARDETGVRGVDRLISMDATAAIKLVTAVTAHAITLIGQDEES